MKKNIFILIGIVLFIYISLSLLGLKGDYNAERALWGINRNFYTLMPNQESTPDYAVEKLAKEYRSFINKYPKTTFAQLAQVMIGDLYSIRKNYVKARQEYQKAIGENKNISAQAESNLAKTYELEGNWNMALSVYKNVILTYPTTDVGFALPIYLTTHIYSADQKSRTDMAYSDALTFYKGIAAKHPKSKLEYMSLRMIAMCQLYKKDWNAAVSTMQDLLMKYPTAKTLQEAVNTINILCVTRLHNYDLGIKIYEDFLAKYPGHPADVSLKKMIAKFMVLKKENLTISTTPINGTTK